MENLIFFFFRFRLFVLAPIFRQMYISPIVFTPPAACYDASTYGQPAATAAAGEHLSNIKRVCCT